MSTIIVITPPPPPPPPPPPDDPKSSVASGKDVVCIGSTTVEFQGGRPTFARLCLAIFVLVRAWLA
ncbi:MAG: hypothetical protein E6Q97_09420 [Desulfurellales bacterium]|nr:MAG: hypothetical protein E6Q97_09420 [Desulfurellales bacterium]